VDYGQIMGQVLRGGLNTSPPRSVMDQYVPPTLLPSDPGYQEPGLEAPMLSPDDLLGTGLPTKAVLALKALAGGVVKGLPAAAALGVVKSRGGQWYTREIDRDLEYFRPRERHGIEQDYARFKELMDGLATDSDPQIRAGVEEWGRLVSERAKPINALDKWVTGALRKYVARDMGTPEDPVRALAEEGITHLPEARQDQLNIVKKWADTNRFNAPAGRVMGDSPRARQWEDLVDANVVVEPAKRIGQYIRNQEPWIDALDQETPIHLLNPGAGADLGFRSIVDALRTNMESGALRPEQLNRVSVADAVRQVHALRVDAEKVEAAKRAAQLEGLPIEHTTAGGDRWVTPKLEHEDWASHIGCESGWCIQDKDTFKNYLTQPEGSAIHTLLDPTGKSKLLLNTRPGYESGSDPLISELRGRFNQDLVPEETALAKEYLNLKGPWSEIEEDAIKSSGLHVIGGKVLDRDDLFKILDNPNHADWWAANDALNR
jgi:hypothetical protein